MTAVPDPTPADTTGLLATPGWECHECGGSGSVEGDLVGVDGEVVQCNAPAVACENCGGTGEVDPGDPEEDR